MQQTRLKHKKKREFDRYFSKIFFTKKIDFNYFRNGPVNNNFSFITQWDQGPLGEEREDVGGP